MEQTEFQVVPALDLQLLLQLGSVQLHLEQIQEEVFVSQQVCVESWGFVQDMEEIAVLELCLWLRALIAHEP